jgi:valyl-tRNA synthetase
VLEAAMRALHPMMPFVTEEIWQRMPKAASSPKSLMIASYPDPDVDGRPAPAVEEEMAKLQAVIVAARTVRSEHDLHPRKELPLTLRAGDDRTRALLAREQGAIATLCNAKLRVEGTAESAGSVSVVAVVEGVTLLAPLHELSDPAKERERLEREIKKADKDLALVDKKLGNADFLARAPAQLVAQERARQSELRQALDRLRAALAKLS